MRPRGEVRDVLASAAGELVQMAGRGVTWRELAQHTQVGWECAKRTADNMAAAGELAVVGTVRVDGCNRPMRAYAPATAPPPADDSLAEVITGWAQFR
jgi:hypothetical protein